MPKVVPLKINAFNVLKILIHACAVLFAISMLLMLSSCNSLKKTISKANVKTDSVHVVKNVISQVNKSDSTGVSKQEGDYERETVIEFENDTAQVQLNNDVGVILNPSNSSSLNGRVRKVTIHEKGNYKNEQAATVNKKDSGTAVSSDSVVLQKQENTVNRDIVKTKVPLMALGFGALLIAFLLWLVFKRK